MDNEHQEGVTMAKTFTEWKDELETFAKREGCSIELAALWSNRQVMEKVSDAFVRNLELEKQNTAQRNGLVEQLLKSLR